MVATKQCPITQVGETLAPYLQDRQEVASIRNGLQAHLEKSLNLHDQYLCASDLVAPGLSDQLGEAPAGLSGVRRAYWNALKAHQEATARYKSLKAEIQALTQSSREDKPEPQSVSQTILPRLQQREKQRKLQVLQKTLSSITSEDGPANVAFDDFIKARAGEMPLLPNVSSTQHGYLEEADARAFELKKAILTAKDTLDEHKDDQPNGVAAHEPQAELYALQQTRNMLISWIEEQLTIVGNAQAANEKSIDSLVVDGEDAPIPVSTDEIGQIYGQYLAVRKKLIQALQHPQRHDFTTTSSGSILQQHKSADKASTMAVAMLPFVEPILDAQAQETTLSQQVESAMKQIGAAESDINKLMRRLADESHLVVTGAASGAHWTHASESAERVSAEYVKTRVDLGMSATDDALKILNSIHALPRALDVAD